MFAEAQNNSSEGNCGKTYGLIACGLSLAAIALLILPRLFHVNLALEAFLTKSTAIAIFASAASLILYLIMINSIADRLKANYKSPPEDTTHRTSP
jgi:hypothetical protein